MAISAVPSISAWGSPVLNYPYAKLTLTTTPVAITTTTYAMLTTDTVLLFQGASACAVTLQDITSQIGNTILLVNLTAFAITSALADVLPLGSLVAGTAILSATVGKWALMQFNGTYWQIIANN